MNKTLTPLKKPHPRNKKKQEEDIIKVKLKKAIDHWRYWKFQVHWFKLGWVYSRKYDSEKKPFFSVNANPFSKKLQDCHWVGDSNESNWYQGIKKKRITRSTKPLEGEDNKYEETSQVEEVSQKERNRDGVCENTLNEFQIYFETHFCCWKPC